MANECRWQVFGAIWSILCWWDMNPTKTKHERKTKKPNNNKNIVINDVMKYLPSDDVNMMT